MEGTQGSIHPTVKIFSRVATPGEKAAEGPGWNVLAKFRVFLEDRPGSLAQFSRTIAESGGNISFFHYDRSLNSSRVAVEVQIVDRQGLDRLLFLLGAKHYSFEKSEVHKEEVQITRLDNVLEIKVRLMNKPGALATFSELLKDHHANVIYMLYDEDIDPESADIALATRDSGEVDELLDAINKEGCYYRVVYRGSDERTVENVIGLKLVEKFFLRLSKLLPGKDIGEIKALVDSSQELHADLVRFYSEAGNNLDAADVFEKVLSLASMSRSRTGERFEAVEMPEIKFAGGTRLCGFRLPTTENIYIFECNGELTMIDSGYGVYYEDIKRMLAGKSFDAASVKRIFVTHPDADHAGSSGYFAREFGTRIFMHQASLGVIESDNRAHGVSGSLSNLNKYYTKLVNRFTECRFPETIQWFASAEIGKVGSFPVIDTFAIGNLNFEVIESRGGHIPGQVFFLNREYGLFFSSDYLINMGSLSSKDKDHLGIYKYLLINPNSNNRVFKEETSALKDLISVLSEEPAKRDRSMLVLPGHGDYYRAV